MRATLLVLVVSLVGSPAAAQTLTTPDASATEAIDGSLSRAPDRNHGFRPRYGVSLGFMTGVGDTAPIGAHGQSDRVSPAAGGELQGRVGLQLDDVLALYYQASFGIAHELPLCIGTFPGSCHMDDTVWIHSSSLVVDFTIADRFQVGIGGSAVVAHFDTLQPVTEVRPGVLLRLGLVLGGRGAGDRRGLSIGLQGNVSFATQAGADVPLVDVALSLGWESF